MKRQIQGIVLLALASAGLGALVLRAGEEDAVSTAPQGAEAERTHRERTRRGPEDAVVAEDLLRLSPEAIASMVPEAAADELRRIEQELEDEHAFDRLNEEGVDRETVTSVGARLRLLTMLRERLLKDALTRIGERLEAYEQTHEARVTRFLRGEDESP